MLVKIFCVLREEKEKLNVWVALLNLENLYGTQEALLKVFDEALRQNEPIDVFFKLVTIYQNSEKYEVTHKTGVNSNTILMHFVISLLSNCIKQ